MQNHGRNHHCIIRNEVLGILTEIGFTCGLVGVGFLISCLFMMGR